MEPSLRSNARTGVARLPVVARSQPAFSSGSSFGCAECSPFGGDCLTCATCESKVTHIMAKTITTVRELRGSFPKVKKIVETEGAVIVSDHGEPKYLLTLYTPPPKRPPLRKDYVARLKKFQPQPMSASAAKALHDENRGDR